MDRLTETDLHFVVRRIPKHVRALLEERPNWLLLAGGFIRDTIAGIPAKDLDLLGRDKLGLKGSADRLANIYRGDGPAKVIVHETDNALTVIAPPRMPVQFITRWTFDEAESCMRSFDFTVCQAVIWRTGLGWASACSEHFYSDLAARRLRYTFPVRQEDAGGSMMRVRKFLARGWNIQADSLGGVIARIADKVQWEKINRLTGAEREKELAGVIGGLLREVDPLLIVNGLEPIDDPLEGV